MSRPPFLELPTGVVAVELPSAGMSGLLAEPPGPTRGSALLVPGFTGSREDFIAILAPLAELGWRTLAVSLPGQGGVPGFGARRSHTAVTLGAAVARAAEWLGTPVNLVGHSLGGLVTRRFVLAEPGQVASWTLMCSGPSALPESRWPELQAVVGALDHGVPLEEIWQAQLAADRAAGKPDPAADILSFLHDRFIRNDRFALADCAEILLTEPDLSAQVAALRARRQGCPSVTVLTGLADDTWPVAVQEALAATWRVPYVLLATGHSPAAEDPPATVAALADIFREQ